MRMHLQDVKYRLVCRRVLLSWCLSFRYKIAELGPEACPAGRLVAELPSYTGKGSGGSGAVICRADGRSPLVVCARGGVEEEGGAQAKKKA